MMHVKQQLGLVNGRMFAIFGHRRAMLRRGEMSPSMPRFLAAVLAVVVAAALPACDLTPQPIPPGYNDTSTDALADTGYDAGTDMPFDSLPDMASDTWADMPPDTASDAGPDALDDGISMDGDATGDVQDDDAEGDADVADGNDGCDGDGDAEDACGDAEDEDGA